MNVHAHTHLSVLYAYTCSPNVTTAAKFLKLFKDTKVT